MSTDQTGIKTTVDARATFEEKHGFPPAPEDSTTGYLVVADTLANKHDRAVGAAMEAARTGATVPMINLGLGS